MDNERRCTCIVCPKGCTLTIAIDSDGTVEVSGYACPKGHAYAVSEAISPMRTLTTTVKATASAHRIPVRTSAAVPLAMMKRFVGELRCMSFPLPVHIGDTLVSGVLGLNVAVVAADDVEPAEGGDDGQAR